MLYKVVLSSTVLHVVYEATAAKSSLGRPILFVERQHSSAFTLSQNGAVTDKSNTFDRILVLKFMRGSGVTHPVKF